MSGDVKFDANRVIPEGKWAHVRTWYWMRQTGERAQQPGQQFDLTPVGHYEAGVRAHIDCPMSPHTISSKTLPPQVLMSPRLFSAE